MRLPREIVTYIALKAAIRVGSRFVRQDLAVNTRSKPGHNLPPSVTW
jgi:hypothetical protein